MSERPNEKANTADFEFAALREARNYRHALVREFAPHLRGRVMEVGSGIGQITELLCELSEVKELLAVEPDEKFCAEFRARLPKQTLWEGTVDTLKEPWLCEGIISINVLEHIGEDERELKSYSRLLQKSRGRLCLFVPARPEIYAPIDKDFGHHRRYTKPELRSKLQSAGFDIVRLSYFNWVGYFAWWMNFRVLAKRSFDVGSVRFFDRMIFPSVYWLESRIVAPPFGQSLIAVAQAKMAQS